ncbi:hypothetical protein DAT35_57765 [Vitiosangium sp. GDMCC 1.1324]|nr:hypothetical protein DAT35_57765 [Vitiosangium sp. GDMCC 1.1324]
MRLAHGLTSPALARSWLIWSMVVGSLAGCEEDCPEVDICQEICAGRPGPQLPRHCPRPVCICKPPTGTAKDAGQ